MVKDPSTGEPTGLLRGSPALALLKRAPSVDSDNPPDARREAGTDPGNCLKLGYGRVEQGGLRLEVLLQSPNRRGSKSLDGCECVVDARLAHRRG